MKYVVVRDDGFVVITDYEKPEKLFEKFKKMSTKVRAKWLKQYGIVYYEKFPDIIFKNDDMKRVYSINDFIERVKSNVATVIRKQVYLLKLIKEGKCESCTEHTERNALFRIDVAISEYAKLSYLLSLPITKEKIEKKKREKIAIKLVKISKKILKFTEKHKKDEIYCANNMSIIEYKGTVWILDHSTRLGFVIRKDATEDQIYDYLQRVLEKYDLQTIRMMFEKASSCDIQKVENLKDLLSTVIGLIGIISV